MNKLVSLIIIVSFFFATSMSLTLVDHEANHTKITYNSLASNPDVKLEIKQSALLDDAEDKFAFIKWKRHILDASEDTKNATKKGPDGL